MKMLWRYFFRQPMIIQIAVMAAFILLIQSSVFVTRQLIWLPQVDDANLFLKTIWQVHASVLGITVIVATIIITVIANERDRSRIWKLYSERTRILQIVWFNLLLIIGEGLAVLQTSQVREPLIYTNRASNLVLAEFVLFIMAVSLVIWLFTETLRFLDEDYVETLAQKRIVSIIPEAVGRDIDRLKQTIARLQGGSGGSRTGAYSPPSGHS